MKINKKIASLIGLVNIVSLLASCGGQSNNMYYPVPSSTPISIYNPLDYTKPNANGPSGTITGSVIDSVTKAGVQGVRVEVKGIKPVIFSYTDSTGKFILNKVPQGKQVVFIQGNNYAPLTSGNVVADVIANVATPIANIAVISVEKDKMANTFVKSFDTFKHPRGISIDRNSSDLFVVDVVGINSILPIQRDRTEIKKINSEGSLLDDFASKFFSNDTSDIFRLVKNAQGIGLDAGGNIYVADTGNNLIKKYGPNGKYVSKIDKSFSNVCDVAVLTSGDIIVSDPGNSRLVLMDSSLNIRIENILSKIPSDGIRGIATDISDNIYVIDATAKKGQVIKKFDKYGYQMPIQFGSIGALDPGYFNNPTDLAIDNRNGDIYVVDSGNNRVQRFNAEGNYLSEFGQFGSGDGNFNTPWGVAIDKEGYVYVSDPKNSRVQKFSPTRAIN